LLHAFIPSLSNLYPISAFAESEIVRINANHDSLQVTSDNKVICGIELCVVEDEPLAPWITGT
jgi:hypothetical protein